MSSAKPKKNDKNKNSGWIDVKSNNDSPSSKRRRRRKKAKSNKNSPNKIKSISTKPKHAAPPNASTIYCQWFQEVEHHIHYIFNSVQGYIIF